MSARTKGAAQEVASAIRESMDLAIIAADWADTRLGPMVEALTKLCEFPSTDPKAADRLRLIRSIASETHTLTDEMAWVFERSKHHLQERLSQLEGGAK